MQFNHKKNLVSYEGRFDFSAVVVLFKKKKQCRPQILLGGTYSVRGPNFI